MPFTVTPLVVPAPGADVLDHDPTSGTVEAYDPLRQAADEARAGGCGTRAAYRTVERVHTWTAAENTHTLALNTALGFREAGAQGPWQLRR